MEKIIKAAVERGASDLHIKAGDVFRARINGKLVALTKQRLTPDQTRAIALKLINSDEDRSRIDRLRDFDCSWGMPGVGRFRVNVLRQRSSFMIVMRVIPFAVPTIESLRLPEALKQVAETDRGLVLVTGVSGSGKSSTVAAMVHHINLTLHKHVVTIENPIEFLHRDVNCSITQREVGVDTDNLTVGLRAALRQDPDVIVLGDMADADTIDTAIKGAETGHLVIGSLPTADVLDDDRAGPRHAPRGGARDRPHAASPRPCGPSSPSSSCRRRARRAGCPRSSCSSPLRQSGRCSRTRRARRKCAASWPRERSSSAPRPTSSTSPSWSRPASSRRRPPRRPSRSIGTRAAGAGVQARRQAAGLRLTPAHGADPRRHPSAPALDEPRGRNPRRGRGSGARDGASSEPRLSRHRAALHLPPVQSQRLSPFRRRARRPALLLFPLLVLPSAPSWAAIAMLAGASPRSLPWPSESGWDGFRSVGR